MASKLNFLGIIGSQSTIKLRLKMLPYYPTVLFQVIFNLVAFTSLESRWPSPEPVNRRFGSPEVYVSRKSLGIVILTKSWLEQNKIKTCFLRKFYYQEKQIKCLSYHSQLFGHGICFVVFWVRSGHINYLLAMSEGAKESYYLIVSVLQYECFTIWKELWRWMMAMVTQHFECI